MVNNIMWWSPGINSGNFVVHTIYITDIPIGIKSLSEPLLMADDASVLNTANNSEIYKWDLNLCWIIGINCLQQMI